MGAAVGAEVLAAGAAAAGAGGERLGCSHAPWLMLSLGFTAQEGGSRGGRRALDALGHVSWAPWAQLQEVGQLFLPRG